MSLQALGPLCPRAVRSGVKGAGEVQPEKRSVGPTFFLPCLTSLGTALWLSRGKAAVLLLQHKEQTGEFRSASQSSEREREREERGERESERSVDRSASNSRAAAEREREIKKQVIATPGTRFCQLTCQAFRNLSGAGGLWVA